MVLPDFSYSKLVSQKTALQLSVISMTAIISIKVTTLSITFFSDGRLKHAYQEIEYRDQNRTMPLYEITVEKTENSYSVSGWYNNMTGEIRDLRNR
jgi:hypothetical protein